MLEDEIHGRPTTNGSDVYDFVSFALEKVRGMGEQARQDFHYYLDHHKPCHEKMSIYEHLDCMTERVNCGLEFVTEIYNKRK